MDIALITILSSQLVAIKVVKFFVFGGKYLSVWIPLFSLVLGFLSSLLLENEYYIISQIPVIPG